MRLIQQSAKTGILLINMILISDRMLMRNEEEETLMEIEVVENQLNLIAEDSLEKLTIVVSIGIVVIVPMVKVVSMCTKNPLIVTFKTDETGKMFADFLDQGQYNWGQR